MYLSKEILDAYHEARTRYLVSNKTEQPTSIHGKMSIEQFLDIAESANQHKLFYNNGRLLEQAIRSTTKQRDFEASYARLVDQFGDPLTSEVFETSIDFRAIWIIPTRFGVGTICCRNQHKDERINLANVTSWHIGGQNSNVHREIEAALDAYRYR